MHEEVLKTPLHSQTPICQSFGKSTSKNKSVSSSNESIIYNRFEFSDCGVIKVFGKLTKKRTMKNIHYMSKRWSFE